MSRLSSVLVLFLLGVALPLADLLAPGAQLLGWSGVGRGEFESWAWFEWWIPRLAAIHLSDGGGLASLLHIPRELDIGNCLDVVALALPAKSLLGPIGGHNLRVALVLALNCGAAWLAIGEAHRTLEVDAPWARIAAALAIACNPITLWDAAESRFAQALLAPGLLYLAALFRLRAETSWRRVLGAAACLALTGLTYWYAAFFLAPLGLLVALVTAQRLRAAAHIGIALVLVTPAVLPFLVGDRPLGAPWRTPFPAVSELTVPPPGVLGPPGPGLIVAQSVDLSRPLAPPQGPSLSWLWVVLAVASAAAWKRHRGLATVVTVGCAAWWVFSLGPWLRLGGQTLGVPLPYQWAYPVVPFLSRLNWPARMLPWMQVGLVLLSVPLISRPRAWIPAAAVLLALLPGAMQGLLPLPTEPLQVSAFYRAPIDGGVIEASFPAGSNIADWLQTWHHQGVLGGQAAHRLPFRPTSPNALIDALEATRRSTGPLPEGVAAWSEADIRRLRDDGFRWVVVHGSYGRVDLPNAAALRVLLSHQLGPPAYRDGDVWAWDLAR